MVRRNPEGRLTLDEKRIAKALLSANWRNQDIQALINIGRAATINSARITEVKKDAEQEAATGDEVQFFQIKKRSFDPETGLNLFDDERLIRAREAMILAVQVFNSAGLQFKTEMFAVLANISWTYLLHEYYDRKGVRIEAEENRTLSLSQMVKREDSPLSDGVRNNLNALKIIRDDVEHKMLGKADLQWQSLYQACCLNFDKVICDLFGERLTLSNELSFALQFRKMDIDQLSILNKYEIPPEIKSIDAQLNRTFTEEQRADLEYQFRVVYMLDSAPKSRAHFRFVKSNSAEGKEIRNILSRDRAAGHLYPHKPGQVSKLVEQRTGKRFTAHNHTQAWRLYKARPRPGAKAPEDTNKEFCIYHPAHKDYTYSDQWVEHLVETVPDDAKFATIKAVKI